MLRWFRRRWRRWLPVGCLAAVVLINAVVRGKAGPEGVDDKARAAGLKHQVMGVASPLAANVGFRKSLQAYSENGPGSPNSVDRIKSPMRSDGRSSQSNPALGHGSPPSEHGRQRQQEPRFKIFVYDLPPRFNTNLSACAETNSDGCYKFDNFGMGPELRRHDHLTYRNTHQLSTEIIIHEKMLRSRYRTLDAVKADAFYVPFYAALACTCKMNADMDMTELYADLWRSLESASPYFGSSGPPRRPHFMALGKIEREFWTSNCPLLRDTERTGGITFIGVEEEVNEELRKYFKRTNKRMIVAPYPSYGHFDSSYTQSLGDYSRAAFPSDIEKTTRDVRIFMAVGSRKGHDVRVILKRQMTGTSRRYATFTASSGKQRRYAVWYSTPECRRDMQLPIVDWMRHSVFCLQPPGDSLTRKSFYDAVMAGCIPVTFKPKKRSASVTYPFQDQLDYTRFTVNIPLDDVLSGSVRVMDRLRIIPESRIADMQRRLADAAPKLQYSHPPTSEDGDAFTKIMEQMQRIAA
ncbi:probable xyloglucan galactosyltransferase GT14 [Acanthaster planci]|uniref:Probable xyloglucan galactosyltransferase GT14 n=1 Tax=Acanthaster planci TaxID=133434 RepID=A0A8B7YFK8_ACAPL|nr:probable xyloglucan galactosyltransferase GT14 [Acanthaster planci]XP_022092021.1 probable xyloglucan galactosyltransferase GT14 [Acanthaster planci]